LKHNWREHDGVAFSEWDNLRPYAHADEDIRWIHILDPTEQARSIIQFNDSHIVVGLWWTDTHDRRRMDDAKSRRLDPFQVGATRPRFGDTRIKKRLPAGLAALKHEFACRQEGEVFAIGS